MAQGAAWVARELGVACRVVVPEQAPRAKTDAVEALGASTERVPFDAWWAAMATRTHPGMDGFFVHPFADPLVMAGNGTIGLELAEDAPDLDALVIPVGGGGLVSGCAIAAKALKPSIEVVGVEAALWLNGLGYDAYVLAHRLPGAAAPEGVEGTMVGGAHGVVFGADDAAEGGMRCAARAGLQLTFENQNARTFSHCDAGSVSIERPATVGHLVQMLMFQGEGEGESGAPEVALVGLAHVSLGGRDTFGACIVRGSELRRPQSQRGQQGGDQGFEPGFHRA